jgi:hypothetical protein
MEAGTSAVGISRRSARKSTRKAITKDVQATTALDEENAIAATAASASHHQRRRSRTSSSSHQVTAINATTQNASSVYCLTLAE